MGIKSFTELDVWKKAHRVVLAVYKVTKEFPVEERYGLTAQIRRAAVSMPTNVAEGFGRRKAVDKARFYNMSQGSCEEVKYLMILSKDLEYVKEWGQASKDVEDVSRMLRRLVQSTLDGALPSRDS